jgi:hypothetical protein
VAAIFRKSQPILIVEMAPPWAGWEGSTSHMMINLAKYGTSCRKRYQAILEGAAAYANSEGTAECDARTLPSEP